MQNPADERRGYMKQMVGSISKTLLVMFTLMLLFSAMGVAFSHAEEKEGISKAVFYVA